MRLSSSLILDMARAVQNRGFMIYVTAEVTDLSQSDDAIEAKGKRLQLVLHSTALEIRDRTPQCGEVLVIFYC